MCKHAALSQKVSSRYHESMTTSDTVQSMVQLNFERYNNSDTMYPHHTVFKNMLRYVWMTRSDIHELCRAVIISVVTLS